MGPGPLFHHMPMLERNADEWFLVLLLAAGKKSVILKTPPHPPPLTPTFGTKN